MKTLKDLIKDNELVSKNKKIRKSEPYEQWRTNIFKRDDFICQKCGKNRNLRAHHIRNFSKYEMLRFKINNGITFCEKCHNEFHKIYGRYDNNTTQIEEFLNIKTDLGKIILVTGGGGMDGSILIDKYLERGITTVGIDKWSPTSSYPNLVDAIKNPNFIFETGDICEKEWMYDLFKKYKPEIVYNMAAISLVPESFKIPERVFQTNMSAVLNMLELIRHYFPNIKFYQASTSEQIGSNTDYPQNTESKMLPNSPYAIAKLTSYHLVRMYRHAFGIFAVNGMLWNHEGPRRGPMFVTRKITLHIASQVKGNNNPLQIGNLDTYRDWGLSDDFCNAMILMMEADEPDDYAVNTGESHSIREFIEEAYKNIGIKIIWKGNSKEEKGYADVTGEVLIEVTDKYYRPIEVPYLHGDHSKIKEKLGWEPKTKFKELVKLMVESDLK